MDRRVVKALIARAEQAFAGKPGVVRIGYGLKMVDGRVTQVPSLRVTVERKVPRSELAEEEILPETFEGVPIDVIEPRTAQLIHCENTRIAGRMEGGLTIGTKGSENKVSGRGTLGYFARIVGAEDPDNVVLLTCRHVLSKDGLEPGTVVYQTASRDLGATTIVDHDLKKSIGKVHHAGFRENRPFTYPGEDEEQFHVDAATARLTFTFSSLCKCFTGTRFGTRIPGLAIPGLAKPDEITGTARITDADAIQPEDGSPIVAGHPALSAPVDPGRVLVKVGRTTARTEGQVVEAFDALPIENEAGDSVNAEGVIEIAPIGLDCNDISQFAARGDSGSVVVDAQGRVVGLLFARGTSPSNLGFGYACHIDPVLAELDIQLITTARPPTGPAVEASGLATAQIARADPEMRALEARVVADPALGPVHAGFMGHWDEIAALVNHRRPLLVAWHRLKGPVFMAHLSESARRPGHKIPREIDGVSRRELLSAMADLLIAEGSAELAAYLKSIRADTLKLAERIDDLHGYVDGRVAEGADG